MCTEVRNISKEMCDRLSLSSIENVEEAQRRAAVWFISSSRTALRQMDVALEQQKLKCDPM